jgi:hypothetical protein
VTFTDQVLGQVADMKLHPARHVKRVWTDDPDPQPHP